ncbi:MAG: SDR family oxidoreductase [Rhodospirillales bacterium]|nr:SDR family oxidoreductase [Rhodospirillales bacterium]MDE0379358.1 SDR family oxidoreductase [Rhodospirillales bacterium]
MSILITGGTKGIGRAIALAFAEPGVDAFLNYQGDDDAAREARSLVEAKGARCHLIKRDVGTPEGARAVLAEVAARTDSLDQLVHCAVRAIPRPALDCDADDFTAAVNLNGTALLYLVQAADPLLVSGSTVFFLTSRGGRTVVPNYAAIGVAKALAESLVRYLASELAPRGVRINSIAPGVVETDALRALFGDQAAEIAKHAAETNPSGRGVRDEDYTSVIRFLASPDAAFVQGQTIFVNGGHFLAA